jgi:catechol 2,3-dioxygenase-like lactoylglutathione lyase family enzyme
MQTASSHITQIATVFAPVADLERALAFYVDTLGWTKTVDFTRDDDDAPGGYRWVEVAPAGSHVNIALVAPQEGTYERTDQTHCALASADIDADYAAMVAAGVEVDPAIAGPGVSRPGLVGLDVEVASPVPRQFGFRDPDGNRFLVVDQP